jgi:uncharacterized protein
MKMAWPLRWKRRFLVPIIAVIALGTGGILAESLHPRVHRVVFQVDEDDTAAMKHAVSNSMNLMKHYQEKGETVRIEIVAYGPGITMFRSDTSPVRNILDYIHSNFPEIAFTVCGNTKAIVEQREGHALSFIEGTRVVPFGIVRLVELQEAGWSYIRP